MKISHKAFLDLEHRLASKTQASWRAYFKPIGKEIVEALKKRDFHKVDKLANSVDPSHLIVEHAQLAQTIMVAALFLGVSRVTDDLKGSHLAKHLPMKQVGNAVLQWGYMVSRNLGKAVRKKLHVQLAALEQKMEDARHTFKKDEGDEEEPYDPFQGSEGLATFEDVVQAAEDLGVSQSEVAASLMVSRMNSFGFLSEAYSAGIERYQINEVLDESTCEVCEAMDGRVFNVSDGVEHATRIMDAEDPDDLADIAPWPDQGEDSVDDLQSSDSGDLVDAGLATPPYHPGCRGICDTADDDDGAYTPATAPEAEDAADEEDVPDVTPAEMRALLGIVGRFVTPAAEDYEELMAEAEEQRAAEEEEDEIEDEKADQAPKKGKKSTNDET